MGKLRLGACGAVVLLAAACVPVAAAKASTITESFSFTASGFSPAGSPVDPWSGSFTITFDPAGGAQSGALDAFSSNLLAGYGTFTYAFFGAGHNLVVGDACSLSMCGATPGTDQGFVEFFPVTASGGLSFEFALLTSTSFPTDVFVPEAGTVTSTPLPAALPLFAGGLGALGVFGWCRKRKAAAAV
jgi:hypothetical protein